MSNDDQRARVQTENIRDLPQTTTMPLRDYWSNLLKACFFVGFPFGVIVTLIAFLTDWYMLLLKDFWSLCLANWWLLPSIILIVVLTVYLSHPRKKGGVKTRKNQT